VLEALGWFVSYQGGSRQQQHCMHVRTDDGACEDMTCHTLRLEVVDFESQLASSMLDLVASDFVSLTYIRTLLSPSPKAIRLED
jgi:hypothetical protein